MKRRRRNEFPIDALRRILDYNPLTGKLVWKKREKESEHWTPRGASLFNSKYAGKEAGHVKILKDRDYTRIEVKLPDGKTYMAHRIIWAIVKGYWPSKIVDHIDHNPLNNRWYNLREACDFVNQQNVPLRSDSTTGLSGVTYSQNRRRWIVDIQCNGKRHTKTCGCLLEAAATRFRMNRELGFHKNHGRKRIDAS